MPDSWNDNVTNMRIDDPLDDEFFIEPVSGDINLQDRVGGPSTVRLLVLSHVLLPFFLIDGFRIGVEFSQNSTVQQVIRRGSMSGSYPDHVPSFLFVVRESGPQWSDYSLSLSILGILLVLCVIMFHLYLSIKRPVRWVFGLNVFIWSLGQRLINLIAIWKVYGSPLALSRDERIFGSLSPFYLCLIAYVSFTPLLLFFIVEASSPVVNYTLKYKNSPRIIIGLLLIVILFFSLLIGLLSHLIILVDG